MIEDTIKTLLKIIKRITMTLLFTSVLGNSQFFGNPEFFDHS